MGIPSDHITRASFSSFNRDFLDPATPLSCIGTGALGGKASGLAFIRNVLTKLDVSKIRMDEIPSPCRLRMSSMRS
jgi:hypothetical protein